MMSFTMSRRVFLQLTGATATAVAATGVAGVAHASASQVLVSDGEANAVVLLPDGAPEQLRWAASELVRVVERSTGVPLPLRTVTGADEAPSPDGTIRICVGLTLPGSDPTIGSRLATLDPDGTVIAPHGDTLTLIGPTVWGSRHAVQEFLESSVGVRWLLPTDLGEDVPPLDVVKSPDRMSVDAPSFTSRVMYPTPSEEREWRTRSSAIQKWGDKARTHWRIQFHHELYTMFDSRKFGDPSKPESYHPEWYPIIKGKTFIPSPGSNNDWQPRFRAPGLVEEAARQIIEYFDANPEAPSYSLGITDGSGFSEDELEGATGGSVGVLDLSPVYWEFVNKVATEVLTQRPTFTDKLFGALAYLYVNDPPPFDLHPQVVPYLTRDRYVWVDPRMAREDRLHTQRWLDVAKQVGWYDYIYGNPYCIPRTPLALYDTTYNWGKRVGVVGVMAELSHNWGEGPKPWAFAQKLWDSDRSMPSLAQEWYERVAGGGSAGLRDYFALWEQIWLERIPKLPFFRAGQHLTYFPFDDMSYVGAVTSEDITGAEDALGRAQSGASTDTQRQRVQVIVDEFAYTRASALSYPKELPTPTDQHAAEAMLQDEVSAVAGKVQHARERSEIWDQLNRDPDLHYRSTKFDRYGAAWSGWNCKTMITLSDYVRANRPGATAIRQQVATFQESADTTEAREWCRHLMLMINDEGIRYGENLGFETGDLSGWVTSPTPAIAAPPQVVSSPVRSGSHSLRAEGGYITCGINQTEGVYPAGEGVWVSRLFYHVPPGSEARGVLVPGVLAHDWTGAQIGYRQDHYVPMVDGRGTWAEARYVDRLPAGTVTVRPVLVSAYHGLDTEIFFDDFEFTYYGALSDGSPMPGAILIERSDLRLTASLTEIVEDPEAADGSAVRLVGGRETWGVQYALAKLPETGNYRIVARIRVDLAANPDPSASGVGFGAYRVNPQHSVRKTYPVSQFVDTGYQWLSFDGTFERDTQGRYLYFTAFNTHVEQIYIDQLYAIPA